MTRTVVLRLFEAAAPAGGLELRGLVEDVKRHSTQPFAGADELIDVLLGIVSGHSRGREGSLPEDAGSGVKPSGNDP